MLDLCIVCKLGGVEKGYYFELYDVKSTHNRWLFVHRLSGVQDVEERHVQKVLQHGKNIIISTPVGCFFIIISMLENTQ